MATQINYSLLQSGAVLQVVSQSFSSVATSTVQIPADDTIPQNTEGTEYMSLSITPRLATSILRVDAIWWGSYAVSHTHMIMAVFRDSGSDALGAVSFGHSGSYAKCFPMTVTATSGSTATTTFKVRVGGTDASTVTFNGASSARLFGGKAASSMTITEILA